MKLDLLLGVMGGTIGIIYDIFCKAAYSQLKADSHSVIMALHWAGAFEAAIAAISKYGGAGASAGYRTLLDALIPASSVLKEQCRGLTQLKTCLHRGHGCGFMVQSSCLSREERLHENIYLVVLSLLRKNRDMLFNEVKLTVSIEDPRNVERRRLLGIDDEDAPTRDELAAVLVEVSEGKIPKDHVDMQMLPEEITQWPNLEDV
ncbi:ycf3-interacting 1, chloroplastic [Olea europaea subsp. europaea]|uniref:Ycf3-interacting 1, chloroplastic n=1 Tax=Olea europaea subsp. europaea TaxID=158383 RepID=A0A8S0PNM9_OLEEU|nr:ycf3-interacting 1, chloroplastic [Olea europaea subsp. europaea]